MSALIPRSTIKDIVAGRNRALSSFGAARDALADAYGLLADAHFTTPGQAGSTSYDHGADKQAAALVPLVKVPERGDFLKSARFITDRRVWGHLVGMTDLENLMDKTAKDQFRQQLMTDPPEVTVENVYATLEQFAADAGTIWKRGIAAAFSSLDRRFRSHDGWRVGSRMIFDRAIDEYGYWSRFSNRADSLRDVERVFFMLDGKSPPDRYAGVVGAIETSRRHGRGARQSEAETEYFKARCFKNGNLHLWFKRDDLVERVNRLLGEYYGAPIPEEREADADTGLHEPKTTLAKNYGFFPTPDAAADALIEAAALARYRGDDGPPLTVLEPSAGTGNLALRCANLGAAVDCVEVHPERAGELAGAKRYGGVIMADFLALKPGAKSYDRVVMNPPFDRERDIDHVIHALKFLKPDGLLVAIMSAGTEFRETRKSVAFREHIAKLKGVYRDLPPGSFASAGTYCNTLILKVRADGRQVW